MYQALSAGALPWIRPMGSWSSWSSHPQIRPSLGDLITYSVSMLNKSFSFFLDNLKEWCRFYSLSKWTFVGHLLLYQWTSQMLGIKCRTRQTLFCLLGVHGPMWKPETEHTNHNWCGRCGEELQHVGHRQGYLTGRSGSTFRKGHVQGDQNSFSVEFGKFNAE